MEKVDMNEYNRQRVETMIKNGRYSEISFFLEEGETEPITKLHFQGITSETMAKNIVILEGILEYLKKEYPLAFLMSKNIDAKMINLK